MAHILVAEDDEMINELVVHNLEAVGHTCVQVYDGAAVLEHLNAGEAIDLLILDVMMPKMSGFEVIEAIGQEALAIFLTAKGGVMNKVKGLLLGAEDYIVKPFEMLELIARVDVVLRRRQPKREVFSNAVHTMILRAISSLMATRASLTLTITFSPRRLITRTDPPTTKPRFSRCFLTSGLPPIFLIVLSASKSAKQSGIIAFPLFYIRIVN